MVKLAREVLGSRIINSLADEYLLLLGDPFGFPECYLLTANRLNLNFVGFVSGTRAINIMSIAGPLELVEFAGRAGSATAYRVSQDDVVVNRSPVVLVVVPVFLDRCAAPISGVNVLVKDGGVTFVALNFNFDFMTSFTGDKTIVVFAFVRNPPTRFGVLVGVMFKYLITRNRTIEPFCTSKLFPATCCTWSGTNI